MAIIIGLVIIIYGFLLGYHLSNKSYKYTNFNDY